MIKKLNLPLVDRIIKQGQEQLTDLRSKQQLAKDIELCAIEILPQLQERKEKIENLLIDIKSESLSVVEDLKKSLLQTNLYIENIKLFAEQIWAQDNIINLYGYRPEDQQKKLEDYALKDNLSLLKEIKKSRDLNDLAVIFNQILIDFDMFEQFSLEDELMMSLVRRINEINVKKQKTHIDKNRRQTLQHLKDNLFKNALWSTEQVDEYFEDKDAELYSKKSLTRTGNDIKKIIFIGASEDLPITIKQQYSIIPPLKFIWADWLDLTASLESKIDGYDLIAIVSIFDDHPFIKQTIQKLDLKGYKYALYHTTNPSILIKKIIKDISAV